MVLATELLRMASGHSACKYDNEIRFSIRSTCGTALAMWYPIGSHHRSAQPFPCGKISNELQHMPVVSSGLPQPRQVHEFSLLTFACEPCEPLSVHYFWDTCHVMCHDQGSLLDPYHHIHHMSALTNQVLFIRMTSDIR